MRQYKQDLELRLKKVRQEIAEKRAQLDLEEENAIKGIMDDDNFEETAGAKFERALQSTGGSGSMPGTTSVNAPNIDKAAMDHDSKQPGSFVNIPAVTEVDAHEPRFSTPATEEASAPASPINMPVTIGVNAPDIDETIMNNDDSEPGESSVSISAITDVDSPEAAVSMLATTEVNTRESAVSMLATTEVNTRESPVVMPTTTEVDAPNTSDVDIAKIDHESSEPQLPTTKVIVEEANMDHSTLGSAEGAIVKAATGIAEASTAEVNGNDVELADTQSREATIVVLATTNMDRLENLGAGEDKNEDE
ncbi:hypothetical protein G7Z17_g1066 [Cylindrodendrum hubeiense]|uniref:Uncharacterized protein n=1 Tax=Cylindrodendrum hubeiense TaxID=595255 RepID=A0A9P5HJ74_9HYPO|nr:hypothetical protein G7Z17_g1066 [Cylindrodendrum hubeiense]